MNRQALLLSILAVILVGALWWVFLYSPGREELAQLEQDILAAENETATLTTRVAELERIRASAPETEALIAQLGSIIPLNPALAGAIRQIEGAAEDAGVRVESLATSRPSEQAEVVVGLHTLSVSMAVEGSYFQIVDFLRRLEDPRITARGIEFTTLSLGATEYPTLTGTLVGTMYAVLDPVPEVDDDALAPAPPPPPDTGDDQDPEATDDEGEGGVQ